MRILFLFLLLFSFPALALTTFTVDQSSLEHSIKLNGQWRFMIDHSVPPEAVREDGIPWKEVTVPHIWNEDYSPHNPMRHTVATYAARLSIKDDIEGQIGFHIFRVGEAFRAYLVPVSGGEPVLLTEEGHFSVTPEKHVTAPDNLSFPVPESVSPGEYWLVFQVSKFVFYKGGLRSPVQMGLWDDIKRSDRLVPLAHGVIIGALLFMAIHQLLMFQSHGAPSFLLLSVACLLMAIRSFLSYGYFEPVLGVASNSISVWRFRFELLTVALPSTVWLHFTCSLYPNLISRRALGISWAVTAVLSVVTLLDRPDHLTFMILPMLQAWLVMNMSVVAFMIIMAARDNRPFARVALWATGMIAVGILNDIYVSWSESYKLHLSEYMMLAFLFIHVQVLATKYASALRNESRLVSDNLRLSLQNKQVRMQASTDHLTGVLNRQGIEHRLDQAWRLCMQQARPVSVMMLDVDNFKQLNDLYGHLVGDDALVFLASMIRKTDLRETDIFGRWGGEEFILALPNMDIRIAERIAERLRRNIEKSALEYDGLQVSLTVSIGLASGFPRPDQAFSDLIHEADMALYQAKKSGKNCVVCR